MRIKDTYTYKNKEYTIKDFCLMKNTFTRNWQESIIYTRKGEPDLIFVRCRQEFENRFKRVSNG